MVASSGLLEKEIESFSQRQLDLILRNVFAIEATEGCSIGCDFCAWEVPKKVRDYANFSTLATLVNRIGELRQQRGVHQQKILLYNRSDPGDYRFDGHDIFDLKSVLVNNGIDCSISICTAIPLGFEQSAVNHYSDIKRISVSHMNRNRLRPYFDGLGIAEWALYAVGTQDGRQFRTRPLDQAKIELGERLNNAQSIDVRKHFKELDWIGYSTEPYVEMMGDDVYLFVADHSIPRTSFDVIGSDWLPFTEFSRVVDRDFNSALGIGCGMQLTGRANELHLSGGKHEGAMGGGHGTIITPNGFYNVTEWDRDGDNVPSRGRAGEIVDGLNVQKINASNFRVLKYVKGTGESESYILEDGTEEPYFIGQPLSRGV